IWHVNRTGVSIWRRERSIGNLPRSRSLLGYGHFSDNGECGAELPSDCMEEYDSQKSCIGAHMRTRLWLAGIAVGYVLLMCAEASAAGVVTFNKDVLPILQRNCQTCHRPGNIAPMSFLTYESTRPWAKAMKAAVITRKMPPWFADPQYGHFSNDGSLKQDE